MRGAFHAVEKLVDKYCAYGFETFTSINGIQSEWLLARKHKVVATEVNRYYQQAKRIIAENREFLDKLADALMERKTLLQKDIKEIRATLRNG